jgi:ankyrin repeat protein
MTQVSLTKETLSQLHAMMKAMNLKVDVVPNIAAAPTLPHTAWAIHKMPRRNRFYKALKTGDAKGVQLLLKNGQDPNITTSEGATPLMAAAFHNQPDIARLLLESGARIDAQDKDGYTALMIAASKGHADVARILIQSGADRSLRDKDDLTALDWAEKNGKGAVAGLLN